MESTAILSSANKLATIAAWLGIIGAGYSIYAYWNSSANDIKNMVVHETSEVLSRQVEESLERTERATALFKSELSELRESIDVELTNVKEQNQRLLLLASTQNLDSTSQRELLNLVTARVTENIADNDGVNKLENRLNLLEEVIIKDPVEALTIPLIKNEISNLNDSIDDLRRITMVLMRR